MYFIITVRASTPSFYVPTVLVTAFLPMPGISASLSTTEMLLHFYFAEANHRTTHSDSLLLVRLELIRCSYLLCPILFNLLMWLSLQIVVTVSILKVSFLLFPQPYTRLCGIICERKCKLSLNIVFSKRNKALND